MTRPMNEVVFVPPINGVIDTSVVDEQAPDDDFISEMIDDLIGQSQGRTLEELAAVIDAKRKALDGEEIEAANMHMRVMALLLAGAVVRLRDEADA